MGIAPRNQYFAKSTELILTEHSHRQLCRCQNLERLYSLLHDQLLEALRRLRYLGVRPLELSSRSKPE